MPTNEYHVEEYKQLMEDRNNRLKEMRQLEVLVVGGLAAIYAWFSSIHTASLPLWYAPVLLPAFGFYRVFVLRRSVKKLNAYIKQLEGVFNQSCGKLKGYETWRATSPPSGVTISTFVFWAFLVLLTIFAPIVMQKEMQPKPSQITTSKVPDKVVPEAAPSAP